MQRLAGDNINVPLVGWIHLEGENTTDLIGVWAKGNSLDTFINGGNTVLIRKLENLRFVPFGEAYVIITDERTVVKYIRAGFTADTWILRSHNSELYEDFEIYKEDVRHLFVVVKVLKELTY